MLGNGQRSANSDRCRPWPGYDFWQAYVGEVGEVRRQSLA